MHRPDGLPEGSRRGTSQGYQERTKGVPVRGAKGGAVSARQGNRLFGRAKPDRANRKVVSGRSTRARARPLQLTSAGLGTADGQQRDSSSAGSERVGVAMGCQFSGFRAIGWTSEGPQVGIFANINISFMPIIFVTCPQDTKVAWQRDRHERPVGGSDLLAVKFPRPPHQQPPR
jgi:hypothetical protein